MIITLPYARMLAPDEADEYTATDGRQALRRIEWAGRISHRSESAQTPDSHERFIKSVVLDHGDWSIVEHASVSVDMLVDRGITHEIVRHRIGAYTQESTRFVNYEKKMAPLFIYPRPAIVCKDCFLHLPHNVARPIGDWTHGEGALFSKCPYEPAWLWAIHTAESAYRDLLARGWRPQEARSVFPNALASRIIATYNLRSWRHFFLMRTSKEAHPQMREVTIPLLAEFKSKIPILFDDIEPEARQIDNLRKAR